jgi:peptide/nickel transport system substrate-binding protein
MGREVVHESFRRDATQMWHWQSNRAVGVSRGTPNVAMRLRLRPCGRVLAVMLSLAVLGLVGGWVPQAAAQKRGGKLVYAVGNDPYSPAPYVFGGLAGTAVNGAQYNSLLRISTEGKVVPELAERYEMVDDTTYVFTLRPGVTFHDGYTLNADDVVFSLNFYMGKESGATRGVFLRSMLDSVEKVDDSTVRLKLKAPNASILQILALRDVPVISKEWVEAGHDYRREYNGTGAFKMVKAVRGEQYQLARYEKYWKAGLPYLDALEFRVIADPFTRADGVRAGEIDLADFLPWQEGEAFEKNPKLQTVKAWSVFNAIILNPKRKPFDDMRVRQALAYAIDRDTTNQIGHGGLGLPITGGLLQQGGQWHCPANDRFYSYQPEKAKQLLAAAGYAKGVAFDLTLANFPPYLESWAVVSENLKAAGFNVNVVSTDTGGMAELRVNGKYTALWTGTSIIYDDPDALGNFYESTGAFYGRAHDFKDDELDALFAKGRTTTVGAERARIYCELERQALDRGYWTLISWRPDMFGLRADVKGFTKLPGILSSLTPTSLEQTWLAR